MGSCRGDGEYSLGKWCDAKKGRDESRPGSMNRAPHLSISICSRLQSRDQLHARSGRGGSAGLPPRLPKIEPWRIPLRPHQPNPLRPAGPGPSSGNGSRCRCLPLSGAPETLLLSRAEPIREIDASSTATPTAPLAASPQGDGFDPDRGALPPGVSSSIFPGEGAPPGEEKPPAIRRGGCYSPPTHAGTLRTGRNPVV